MVAVYWNDENATTEITLADTIINASHNLIEVEEKNPSYTEEGNIHHWYCAACKKYFKDANADTEISREDTIIPRLKATEYLIEYDVAGIHTYLKNVYIENTNPTSYTGSERILLSDLSTEGYSFNGWYDAPQSASTYNRVSEIPKGSTGAIKLYAHWTEDVYNITYNIYQTPIQPIGNEYKSYKVSEGLTSGLPNPEIYNYVFLGWYTEDGKEITKIPAGTTGDIELNAYWTSKRNLTKAITKLGDPIICEDTVNGVIYFAYEIGTVENVPLSDAIWKIDAVSGLSQQVSETVTQTVSNTSENGIAYIVSKSTVDSNTWTLSEDWNESVQVNEEWAVEEGYKEEDINTIAKTDSNTYSLTSTNGGASTTTSTEGTTTLTYDSKNVERSKGAEFEVNAKVGYKAEASAGFGDCKVSAGYSAEIGASAGYQQKETTNTHTGTDTTTVDTTVNATSSNWNKTNFSSETKTASESSTVSTALSEIISETKGYGSSYIQGGSDSTTQGTTSSESDSMNTSSTVTYFTSEVTTTTKTYSTDGKSEGSYRLVMAGKLHVFAVVGYNVATNSYFTYTYSVLDDEVKEFLDYSSDGSFTDNEYGALPFEVPYTVYEYVMSQTAATQGLSFKTNSTSGTATVIGYDGTDTDVTIPTYYSAGETYYKVTGIAATAFAGKNIRSISLGEHIDEIPDGAFKNCTALEQISGYFTQIGKDAFSGCTSLEGFTVAGAVTEIGTDAFLNVPKITVNALNAEHALGIMKENYPDATDEEIEDKAAELTQSLINSVLVSGADSIVLNLGNIVRHSDLTLEVPEITYFELQGGKKTFTELKLESDAATTVLKEITIINSNRIPLDISSSALELEVVSVQSNSYALLLSSTAPTITMKRDNLLVASGGEAIVWNAPILSSAIIDGVVGYLDVSGNVYTYGDITGQTYLDITNGSIISLTQDEFSEYIKGAFNVTFDANGGDVDETTRVVFCGTEIGTLPIPTRTGYDFDGWYTSDDTQIFEDSTIATAKDLILYAKWTIQSFNLNFNANGGSVGESVRSVQYQQPYGTLPVPKRDYYTFNGWYTGVTDGSLVTAETLMELPKDVTIYAHWTHNPVSSWVKASEMPSGAEVINKKWTYTETLRAESPNTSMSGYSQTGSYWVESGSGSTNYSTAFPSGFDTNHWIYTSFAKEPFSAYENATNKRVVSNNWAGFVYWHWMYNCGGGAGTSQRPILNKYGTGVDGYLYQYFGAFTSTNGNYTSSTYYCNNLGITNYVIPERTAYADCQGSTRWFRFDYYVSDYTDYYKMFQYQKVENKESTTEVSASSTISNVQKWVQYRAK